MTLAQRHPIPDLADRLRELHNRKRLKAEDENFAENPIIKRIQEVHEENRPHQLVESDSTDDLFKSGNTVQIELRGDQSAIIFALDTLQDMNRSRGLEWRLLKH